MLLDSDSQCVQEPYASSSQQLIDVRPGVPIAAGCRALMAGLELAMSSRKRPVTLSLGGFVFPQRVTVARRSENALAKTKAICFTGLHPADSVIPDKYLVQRFERLG
jgi:hypothetical protein